MKRLKKQYFKKHIMRSRWPRLCIFRSNKHIYGQLIDDVRGHTLCSCSTLEKSIKICVKSTAIGSASQLVGSELAKRAIRHGLLVVNFRVARFAYKGRVATLINAMREQRIRV